MHRTHAFAILAAAALAAPAAHAVEIYATNHLAGYPDLNSDALIRFDSSDPSSYEVVGLLGVDNVGFGGLEFDTAGNLWGYATFFKNTGGATSGLYRIDPSTGAATLQGTRSPRTLTDLAFNPVDGQMYGIFTQGLHTSRLYTVDLVTGSVTEVGTFSGLGSQHNLVGLAIDADGNFYVHDNVNNIIYGGDGLDMAPLYDLAPQTVGSQGMTIDWSRDNLGYQGAVGQGDFPNYYSTVNTFALDGSSYVIGGSFGPNYPDGLPPVQPGDFAIRPVPAPGAMLALLLLAPASRRRR